MIINAEIHKWLLLVLKQPPTDIRTVVQTPWSYVLKISTDNEFLYLKHTPILIAEVNIIQLLHAQFGASVPEVIAHHPELNCFLMKDAGCSLRSILKEKFDTALLCKAIDQFTSLQIAIADQADVFLNIGVPDWRLNKLPHLYGKAISQKDLLLVDGLAEIEINKLETLLPKITYLCQKLSEYAIKESIVQPDFNDTNTLIDDKTQIITMIDLGEIAISHPFFSLINFLHVIQRHHSLSNKDDMYRIIRNACLKNYIHFESEKNILAAFEIASVLLYVFGLLAYDRLIRACGQEKLLAFQHGKLAGMLKKFIAACEKYDVNV